MPALQRGVGEGRIARADGCLHSLFCMRRNLDDPGAAQNRPSEQPVGAVPGAAARI